MLVSENAFKGLKQVGAKVDPVEEIHARVEKAAEQLRALRKPKSEQDLTQMRLAADRLDGEQRVAAYIAVGEAEEENQRIREETIRLGRLLQQRRNEEQAALRKAGVGWNRDRARELEGLMHGKLPWFQAHPEECPARVAEIVAQAEMLDRAFFPEGLGDFLASVSPDVARIAAQKRAKTTVSVEV